MIKIEHFYSKNLDELLLHASDFMSAHNTDNLQIVTTAYHYHAVIVYNEVEKKISTPQKPQQNKKIETVTGKNKKTPNTPVKKTKGK